MRQDPTGPLQPALPGQITWVGLGWSYPGGSWGRGSLALAGPGQDSHATRVGHHALAGRVRPSRERVRYRRISLALPVPGESVPLPVLGSLRP